MSAEYESVECKRCGRTHFAAAWCMCVPRAEIDAHNAWIAGLGGAAIPPPSTTWSPHSGSAEYEPPRVQDLNSLPGFLSALRPDESVRLDEGEIVRVVAEDGIWARGLSIEQAQRRIDAVRSDYSSLRGEV